MNIQKKDAVTYLGRTTDRPYHKVFGMYESDRAFHMHVVGKTGTGKTTFLEQLLRQDIARGQGLTLIDPHGDLAKRIAAFATSSGRKDIVYLDAADTGTPYGYNPLKRVGDVYIPLAVSGLLETFRKRFADAWGVRMEHVFRNALYAILDTGGGTLSDVLRLISEKDFRSELAGRIRNPVVKQFWQHEFGNYSDRYRADSVAPIQNKLSAFLTDWRVHPRMATQNPPPVATSNSST